ncbi:unnamed protein product [Prorocentrum cordatum]|uniref:AMP-dependent synthetase/ligase domain-containing protein n=1 Tax=Prorocentrum cordatum TaxID=2364126 RepID=A0ABN9XKB0_9DINO|nr:unnamed protein product [Polarella glacialis]
MPIIRSSIPDVEIDKKSTLTDYVLSRASKFANSQVVDGPSGRAVSYAALLRAIRGTARGLQQAGLGKGEAVAVWMPNSIEYPEAYGLSKKKKKNNHTRKRHRPTFLGAPAVCVSGVFVFL